MVRGRNTSSAAPAPQLTPGAGRRRLWSIRAAGAAHRIVL